MFSKIQKFFFLLLAGSGFAFYNSVGQGSDENASVASEETVVDDAVAGGAKVAEPVIEEPKAEGTSDAKLVESVESLAAEALKEPAVAEPKIEEPVVEAPAVEPVIAEPVAVEPVAEPVVAEPVAVEPVVAEPAAEPVVAEPVAVEPAAEPVVAEPVVAEPVAVEPAAEPVVAEPVVAEPVAVEPAAEPVVAEPVAVEPVAEPVVAEPVVAEPVAVEPVAEPVVAEPVVAEPVAVEPAVEPVVVEPAVVEPVAVEPVAEPVVAEPAVVEPVAVEPAAEPVVAEPAVVEPVAVEPVAEPVVAEPVAVEPVAEPVVAEPVAVEPVAEPVVAEPAVVEPVAVEPAAEPVVAEPAAVVEPTVEEPKVDVPVVADPVAAEPAAVEPAGGQSEDVGDLINKAIKDAVKEGIPPAPVLKPTDPVSATIDAEVENYKRAQEAHALESIRQADIAFKNKDYSTAINLYKEALKDIGSRRDTAEIKKKAKISLGESYYLRASYLLNERDFDNAKNAANSAYNSGNNKALDLLDSIEKKRTAPPPVPKPTPRKPRITSEDYKKLNSSNTEKLKMGREYFATGELDKSADMYKAVLAVDPNNTEAIRLLEKVSLRRQDVVSHEVDATRKAMIADVKKSWTPQNYLDMDIKPTDLKPQDPINTGTNDVRRLQDKMNRIVIPEVDFRQANINDVVQELQTLSVDHDPEQDPALPKGVNLVLNLGRPAGAAVAPADAPAADGGLEAAAEAAPAGDNGGVPLITFSARFISLLEALKIITNVANLEYRIQGRVVMIVPPDFPFGELQHRMYNVMPLVGERIAATRAEIGGGGGGGGEVRELEPGAAAPTEYADWKNFFTELGVKWPRGSSIKHLPSIGKLSVANTPDNLAVFESILAQLNVVPRQIEIEARFVEVRQTDLDALGFEWLLTDPWEVATKKSDSGKLLGQQQKIVVEQGGSGFGKLLRYADSGIGLGTAGAIADSALTISSVLTNPELSLVIHALQQKGNADLLSSPKVTTQSGQEATIKVVTEYIYPTDFQVTPITATSGGGAGFSQIVGGIVEPSGFETREVGVILQVMPEVSPEGQMINLTLTPQVVSDPTWKDYGTKYVDAQGNEQTLPMEQPFFHTRSVSTSLSIYNGATVVMGGMITEARASVDDKVPFLGDLPIIGRLFRSKYDQQEKRNLLIFVTAKLVDPSGRHIKDTGEGLYSKSVPSNVPALPTPVAAAAPVEAPAVAAP